MATKTTIDDEFAFLDVPAGGVDLDSPPDGSEAAATAEVDSRLMNPLTGSLVDTDDIDSLILACVDAKQQLNDLHSFEDTIRRRLGDLSKGTAKTRRVQGKCHAAKLEMPDDSWNQSILKQAWETYPKYRGDYLRIGSISPQLREVKKLDEMATDDPAFETFKGMIGAAKQAPTGAPRVVQEK